MYLSVTYDENLVKELIEKDKLLQFRLNLILNKEMKTETEAYKSIFKNEISNDVFRMKKYIDLLNKKN